MADRLSLAHAIESAGIGREIAEQIAGEIDELIHENVATKPDLALLRVELRADIAALRTELLLRIAELEHRLTVRFASVMVVLTGIILTAIRYLPHS